MSTKKVYPGKSVPLSEGEAIIFGKIVFIENNKEKIPYNSWRLPIVSIFNADHGKDVGQWSVDKDGSFYWIVPRGVHIISEIRYDYTIRPQIAFQVPSSVDAFYLGTLKLDITMKRIVARHYLKSVNSITITDEFDKAKETLLSRNPEFTSKIGKSLMIHTNPSLPNETYTPKVH